MKDKIIIGIDPGPEKSAYVFICGDKILEAGYTQNDVMLHKIMDDNFDMLAVEGVRSFGPKSPIGNETLISGELAGRFYQAARSRGKAADILYRNTGSMNGAKTIHVALCGENGVKSGEVDRVVKRKFPGCWINLKGEYGQLFLKIGDRYHNHKISAAAVALTYQGSEQYKKECAL